MKPLLLTRLSLANHKTGYFRKRGRKIFVQRGQVGRSIKGLADRWQWSQGKVKRFLRELEDEGQTESKSDNLTTLISIVNYDRYQIGGEQTEHQTESRRRADGDQTETYNKDKKDREGKEFNIMNTHAIDFANFLIIHPAVKKAEAERNYIDACNYVKLLGHDEPGKYVNQKWAEYKTYRVSQRQTPYHARNWLRERLYETDWIALGLASPKAGNGKGGKTQAQAVKESAIEIANRVLNQNKK